jgi:hypothetical protein
MLILFWPGGNKVVKQSTNGLRIRLQVQLAPGKIAKILKQEKLVYCFLLSLKYKIFWYSSTNK